MKQTKISVNDIFLQRSAQGIQRDLYEFWNGLELHHPPKVDLGLQGHPITPFWGIKHAANAW